MASPPKGQLAFRSIQIRGLRSSQEARVVDHVDGAVWLEACFHGIAAVVVDDPRGRVLETGRAQRKCHGYRYRGQGIGMPEGHVMRGLRQPAVRLAYQAHEER